MFFGAATTHRQSIIVKKDTLPTWGAKILLWSGLVGFAFCGIGIWFTERRLHEVMGRLWIALLFFLAALALGMANFAWVFLRHPVFSPNARTVPKKYFGIALALLLLLGLGLML